MGIVDGGGTVKTMVRGIPGRRSVISASFMLIVLVILSLSGTASARAPNTCVECHSDYYQYIDILQEDPGTSLPSTMAEGGTTTVTVVLENYCSSEEFSELERVTVALNALNGYIDVEGEAEQTKDDMKVGRAVFTWTVTCLAERAEELLVTATALNAHYDTPLRDEYTVLVNAPLMMSSTSVEVRSGGSYTLTLTAMEDLSDIRLVPQKGLGNRVNVTPSYIISMDEGESLDVTILSTGGKGASGEILVSWSDEDGDGDSFSLRTELFGSGGGGSGSGQRLAGRILGWVSTVLLVFSIILGGFPRRGKRSINKLLGNARRRVRIHCLISFEILLITILHSAILMLGHWSFMLESDFFLLADTSTNTGYYIDLGTIALAMMAVIGFQGSFQKTLMKVMGPKVWRYSHLLISLTALALVIIHAITVGTTFQPYVGDLLP